MDYRFIDKDNCIDVVRQGLEASPMTIYEVSDATYQMGRGVAVSTIQSWLYGPTKRPQRYSFESVCLALGIAMQFVWTETGKRVTVPEHFFGVREGTLTARKTRPPVEAA